MSGVTLWTSGKTVALTGERRHLHKGTLPAPGFTPPPLAPLIHFEPTALAAAIARTATLRAAPPELLAGFKDSALSEAQLLVADGPGFALSPHLAMLADTERTHFAARVGAGITDIYMNTLGYTWRDNAASLALSLQPHADFLYDGGSATGHGVVLAEARGSFAATVTDKAVAAAAERKYLRQVRPYVGATSPHGDVIHGYALAFGCQPTAANAFLRLSQTRRPKAPSGGKPPGPSSVSQPPAGAPVGSYAVPTGMALAAHRSNFILMDALPIADWIDWLSGAQGFPDDDEPVLFLRIPYAGRTFLACADMLAPYRLPLWVYDLLDHPLVWRRWERRSVAVPAPLRWFVMEEKAATTFLNALAAMVRFGPGERPARLELPTGDTVGLSSERADHGARLGREAYEYSLFRDGLALLGGMPPKRIDGFLRWHPKEGLLG